MGTQAFPCMHDIEGRICMAFGVEGIDRGIDQYCLEIILEKAPSGVIFTSLAMASHPGHRTITITGYLHIFEASVPTMLSDSPLDYVPVVVGQDGKEIVCLITDSEITFS